MSYQPQLFETEDQYGNDIIQGPKLVKQKLTKAQAMIDPKILTQGKMYKSRQSYIGNMLYNVYCVCDICEL